MSASSSGNTSSKTDVLFLCLAQNCEASLPSFFLFLENLQAAGLVCAAIVGENGSSDRTRELLESHAHITLVDTTFMAGIPHRLARMACGREFLLETARSRNESINFICVTDLDNVMLIPPKPATFCRAIDHLRADNTLFAIGASSYPIFYDLLAFRGAGHDYTNLGRDIEAAKKNPLTYYHFHSGRIYRPQLLISQQRSLSCESSFNGLCIYHAADYFLGSYRSLEEAQICEHVTLNLGIAKATGKRMRVSHDLSVQAPADHIPVNIIRFWINRLFPRSSRR